MPELSILIPTYNYNARALVESMLSLARAEHLDVEALVGDDCSTLETEWMDELCLPQPQTAPVQPLTDPSDPSKVPQSHSVRVLRAEKNLGRARNRNRLAEAARGTWLLMVDCDAALPPSFSLRAYLNAARSPSSPSSSSPSSSSSSPSSSSSSSSSSSAHTPSPFGEVCPVVCGGLLHPSVNPCPEATLRYRYERAADLHRSAAERRLHPYDQLSTFSLLIRRDLFLHIRFDEACTDYGYEDTLFGAELYRRGIPVCHIDNPLLHIGLEPNDVFLAKTETALRTLSRIAPQLEGHSRLLASVRHLRRFHLVAPVRLLYRLTYKQIRRNLLGKHPSLKLFAFYKLGYYLNLICHSSS